MLRISEFPRANVSFKSSPRLLLMFQGHPSSTPIAEYHPLLPIIQMVIRYFRGYLVHVCRAFPLLLSKG